MHQPLYTTGIVAAAMSAALSCGIPPASAGPVTTLFDNTNGGSVAIGSPGGTTTVTTNRGITFTVGASDMMLNQATFGMYANSSGNGNVGLRLYAGAAASGTVLQQVTAFSVQLKSIANGGTSVTFNTSGWTLSADTQYTVAVYGSSGTVSPRLGISSLSAESWTSDGLTFNRFTSSGSAINENFHVKLSGTVISAVPGAGLAGLATVGLAGIARRRRR